MIRSGHTKGWVAALVVALAQATACATVEPGMEPLPVDLERDVYFSADEGDAILVPAGSYLVEDTGDARLRLRSTGGNEVVDVPTVSTRYEDEELQAATVRSFAAGEDEHALSLRFPDGVSLEARGTYSGIVPRAGTMLARRQVSRRQTSIARVGTPAGKPLTFSPGGFRSRSEHYQNFGSYAYNLMFRTAPTASAESLTAYLTLALPDGTTITGLQYWYQDTDPYKDGEARLLRTSLQNMGTQEMARVTSSGSGGYGSRLDTTISHATIDNRNHGYVFVLHLPRHYSASGVQWQIRALGLTLFVNEP